MNSRIHMFVVVLTVSLLAGCSSMGGIFGGGDDDVAIEDRGTQAGEGAVSTGLGAGMSLESYLMENPDSPLTRRVVYFDFDSAEIKSADLDLLSTHAAFLSAHPNQFITLDGHTDERGTREYNIALGERRAISVQRVLELNGVAGSQINTVSYGEEKPAADGRGEAAWRLNRRVEIVYKVR